MSTVSSKNKEKRSRSSSNEANNSFVKNVTSRVSGLLPATITKWFSSPSSSNANGSTQAADATDSSTEDEATESPILTQPPLKRMRFSSPGKNSHFSTDNCAPTNIDTIEQITPYSAIQSPPGRTTFRRETNYVSTPVRAPNDETIIERSERDSTTYKCQHSVINVGPSVAPKRKSLFDTSSNREASMRALRTTANNTMVDPKAPCFKPSLLGSPFYPGHTMYGGASMYINQPNIKQRKVALVNESNSSDTSAMSHSARRVMDLLENYSSPLMEAKRMSQYVRSSRNDTVGSSTISGSPYANKVLSYKTQELHVPNIASILRLKQRSRLMDTTNAARQIIASHSSSMPEYTIQSQPPSNTQMESEKDANDKFTTKVKTRLTRQNRGESIDHEEPSMTVNLPTAVLQIDKDNLPKFTFGTSPHKHDSDSNTPSIRIPSFTFTPTTATLPVSEYNASVKIGDSDISKPETVFSNDSYKFSSPVRISSESEPIQTTPPKFSFGSPERGIDKPKTNEKKVDDSSIVVGTAKPIDKPAFPQAKIPSKCTVCKLADSQSNSEKCVNCGKSQFNNNTGFIVLKSIDPSTWKCEDCWVNNDENVDKCVCCGAKNPKQVVVVSKQRSTAIPMIEREWKCDECWIKNKANVTICAACGATRPGAKQTSASALPINDFVSSMFRLQDNSMKNMVKSQNDKWECPSCLVRNEKDVTKCVCCESDKPGLVTESIKSSFNFGITANTSFKFGIDPKPQESVFMKLPDIKPSESLFKPEESETNNNIVPKTTFSFGIPAKLAEDQIDTAKENKNAEIPKVGGFTFGIPKIQSKVEPAVVTPLFGTSTKLTESVNSESINVEKEKPQEVPKIDFKFQPAKETPKPIASIFGTTLTQENKDLAASSTPSLLNQLVSPKNKESIGTPLTLQPSVTSSESTPQKSTFTFSGIHMASNLFAAPASAAPTPAAALFQKPEPAPTPALSLFQKPDVATTSTISLFQKTETITTATPPPLAATAPVFSFGTNNPQSAAPQGFGTSSTQSVTPQGFGVNTTPSAAPPSFGLNNVQNVAPPTFGANNMQSAAPAQNEKPKFNFTFGGNTPLFNNTSFSASTDNNSNKFNVTGNNLGGNGLSAVNPLAGGNGLAPSKLGISNDMSVNPITAGSEMPNLFGTPTQKENLWSAPNNNSTNLFVSSATTAPMQKPPAFTFGAATPFNANNTTPAFGTNPPPAQNMFGMNQNTSAQPSLFGNPVQNQSAPSLFGNPQPAATPAAAMNLFGTPSVGATPTFGTPNPSIPSFEAPSLNPAPAPAFNFGAPQTTGVFGFGQQPQQMQPQMAQQTGVYSFGGSPGGPQVQFTMGSAPSTGVRRVRKAVRRNPQR